MTIEQFIRLHLPDGGPQAVEQMREDLAELLRTAEDAAAAEIGGALSPDLEPVR